MGAGAPRLLPSQRKKTRERSERESSLKNPKKTEVCYYSVKLIQGPDLFVDNGVAIPLRIFSSVREELTMQLSARNQLHGKVKSVKLGSIMAEVVLVLPDGQEIVSAITRSSAESLGLAENDEVLAIIKSTEVMVGRP